MEQEVYVPMPTETVRRALADAERIARSIPGLALDAGEPSEAGALAGRLRLRIAGSTITYRGSLRLTPQGEALAVAAEGTESRGTGSVKAALTLTPRPAEGSGTVLACAGTVSSDGRLAAVDPAQARSAGTRLLERFAESLAAGLESDPLPETAAEPAAESAESAESAEADEAARADEEPAPPPGTDPGDDNERVIPGIPSPEPGPGQSQDRPPAGAGKVFDADVPPPSLDPLADDVEEEPYAEEEPEAEAAHARRTMIGRSAEEVDHAPPRGRYAPMPAPDAATPAAGLRWVAPAAALAVATAVIVSRALRRRR